MFTPRLIGCCCMAAGDSPASREPVCRGHVVRNSTAPLASLFLMGFLLVAGNVAQGQASASSSPEKYSSATAELAK